MRRLLSLIAVGATLLCGAASAMNQSAVPPKFPIPWGQSAGTNYVRSIPIPSQVGSQNCAASLTDGFPPLTFIPSSAGGCPPFGQDFNGILKQLSQWGQWLAAGSPTAYDSAFQSSIGGYPAGAQISSSTNGCFWLSTADNNTSNPETGGANWAGYCPGQAAPAGAAGASTGSANAQVVTVRPFSIVVGSTVTFVAGFSNTAGLQINVNGAGLKNLFRRSQLGATMSVGGEVHLNELVTAMWDGTEWQCMSCKVVVVGQSITIMGQAGMAAPAGMAYEDGTCRSQTTYADLFAVSGNQYGSGCSAGQFQLPNLQGSTEFAADNQGSGTAGRITTANSGCAGNVIGTFCGAAFYQIKFADLPSIPLSVSLGGGNRTPITTGVWNSASTINNSGVSGDYPQATGAVGNATGMSGTAGNATADTFSTLPPLTIAYKLVQL